MQVMALISLTLLIAGHFDNDGYQWFLFVVYNISYTVALFTLFYVYLATRRMCAQVCSIGNCQ